MDERHGDDVFDNEPDLEFVRTNHVSDEHAMIVSASNVFISVAPPPRPIFQKP